MHKWVAEVGRNTGPLSDFAEKAIDLASFAATHCWIWVDFAESGIFDSQFYELASHDTIFYHIIKERRSRRNHIIQ